METIKISKSNFWYKLRAFFMDHDAEDTCSLRKDLIIITCLGLLFLPLTIFYVILRTIDTNSKMSDKFSDISDIVWTSMVIYFITYLMGFAVFSTDDIININLINILLIHSLGPIILLIGVGIILLVVYLVYLIINSISENARNKRKAEEQAGKTRVIKELKTSFKEKYCKRIEYFK